MARTKQTARKCLVGKAPRKGGIQKKKRAPLLGGKLVRAVDSESESELQEAINTQQFSLRFDDQEKCEEQCVTGDIIKCKECEAILTSQGKVIDHGAYSNIKNAPSLSDAKKQKFLEDYESVWICEFCLCHNGVKKNYKSPHPENPCFLIEKSKQKKGSGGKKDDAEKMLIFCIDISGSMDFKSQPGLPTRLESVREAISDQISRMKQEKVKMKVGLITFGSYVTLIGDGRTFQQERMDHTLYHSFDGIVKHCSQITDFCQPVERSFTTLKKIVDDLSTYGSTALGPGLLSAIEIASKGAIGSKVIICTDGQANVGIGGSFNMDRFTYYTQVAEYAKKKGVMVNILSLKGDRCNLKELGKLSLATGGAIMKIDPYALGTEFSKITEENVLGTNSELVIKLNKIFRICSVDPKQCSEDMTAYKQDFGNFTAETELTFEFSVLHKEDASKIPSIDIDLYEKNRIPMQIQLSYTGRDGSKFLQVITDWRELTNDVKAIYDGANFGLFAASILQRASKKIKDQEFKDAQALVRGYWSLVKETFSKTEKKEELEKFQIRVKKIERVLNSKMIKAGVEGVKKSERDQAQAPRGRGGRVGRGGRGRKVEESRSRSRDKGHLVVESDSEEEVLWNEMRARSRSISPPKGRSKGRRK